MNEAPALPQGLISIPIAHRALHDRSKGRIENARASVRAALEAGYGIEIDIQQAACGTPVVFHDPALDRLTAESGPVHTRTAMELGRIELTDGNETIPTLAEILSIVDGKVPLLVEIKSQDGHGPRTVSLAEHVAALIAGYAGPVAVMSFNPYAVEAFGRACPGVARGLTTYAHTGEDWRDLPPEDQAALSALSHVRSLGCSFFSHDRVTLNHPPLKALRAEGRHLLSWTIRNRRQEIAARRIVDNVTFENYLPEIDPI